jgi:predicted Zn-dependent protease
LAITLRAELQPWLQHLPGGPMIQVFFRSVPMPGGAIDIRRPPKETIPALTQKIAAAPNDASLYRMRAAEEELALDLKAAEADWRKLTQLSKDRGSANLELADYFHRHLQPRDELATLRTVTQVRDNPQLPLMEQPAWQAFQRLLKLANEQRLPPAVEAATQRAWALRYPQADSVRRSYIEYLIQNHQYAEADAEVAAYAKTFPSDDVYLIEAHANLASLRGSTADAIKVYDDAFQPLWTSDLDKAYFELLDREGRLREYTGRVRAALLTNAADLNAAARLFHYYMYRTNAVAARRVLVELRLAKEAHKQPWTSSDLLTLAHLFERLSDVNETARFYYALYSLPGAAPMETEEALAGLIRLLFSHAGGLRFGAGDLSFYRDIASVDASPGFFNGILSLVLNKTSPEWAYAQQDQLSVAYFQRARAAEMLDLFDKRFPQSTVRSGLHASLIQTFADYGDDNAIVTVGRAFLTAFPKAPERNTVALLVADAYARGDKVTEEFAIYDQLLRELAAKARGVPLGAGGSARSTEYAAVLDRYLARLAALKRPMDALRLYRRELDRNPNDAGLYERLAAYLEQNGAGQDVEATYRRAIAKFPDNSWYDKLARWYLRQKQAAAFDKLTREVTAIFSGTDLERYMASVTAATSVDPALYRQINLYAHERFPENLTFVHNLMNAYARKETRDDAASDRLLRQYWFYETDLRNRLFEKLASADQLDSEIAAIKKQIPDIAAGRASQAAAANPAASQFAAEAEAWLSHFEAAAPEMRALAEEFPGSDPFTTRASMVYRSLAAFDPANTDVAVSLADAAYQAKPLNRDTLANIGDIYADRERFDRARPVWNRMPRIEPGKTEGYLEAATVFWDYYLYNDALRVIRQARTDFKDPTLFSFETGVIYENKRDYSLAIQQYVAGAMHGDNQAQQRLLRLATLEDRRDLVDKFSTEALSNAPPGSADRRGAVRLRAIVLAELQRPEDLEKFLLAELANSSSAADLETIGEMGTTRKLNLVQTRAMERRVSLTTDPVEKMRLRIDLVKLYEQTGQGDLATRTIEELYRESPLILGVVRASVDFYTRNKQPDRAITTLLDAAGHARSDLSKQFTLEAANISTDAGNFNRARTLLTGLLKDDPYRGEYQVAMAATYSKAGDDRGLRDYQLATIDGLKNAPIPAAERGERIAGLRRTLIPSLTRLKDFVGAVQQYIEVLNRYPEDDALAREAFVYASAHNRTAQLLDFYKKTMADAPRDYRWPILYGRLQTCAEDYPAAIAAYDLAMKARPDRGDVVQARAQLEERLMRFDDATRSYARLYDLTYRDPQWMIKIAEMHARQGQPDQAVTALKTAIIGAKTETPEADFEIASKLESWNLIPQALPFVESGAQLAGSGFAARTDLGVYARVMTRSRRIEPVLGLLANEKTQYLLPDAGAAIAGYYTPEEKATLEKTLLAREQTAGFEAKRTVFIPLAAAAGFTGLETRWRLELMSQPTGGFDSQFVKLQMERTNYEELARQLEAYAAAAPHASYASIALTDAAMAYSEAGDTSAQLRILHTLRDRGDLASPLLDRYLATASANQGDELIALIRSNTSDGVRNLAVHYAVANGTEALAMRAIEARGTALAPVWTKSYTALTGLYYADSSPQIGSAFASVLDTRTIGERIKSSFNKNQQLAHEVWFYYGSRYGEYLDLMKRPAAREYLPSIVEKTPGNPEAYLALGDYYADVDNVPAATSQFEYMLQLDADRGDAHNRIARMLWAHGQHSEALARWRSALAVFLSQQGRGGRVPEPFWQRVIQTIGDIGRAKALVELRPDTEKLLTDYINRNGSYRSSELVSSAFDASLEAKMEPSWLIEMAAKMGDGGYVLNELVGRRELSIQQKIQIQRMRIALLKRADASATLVEDRVRLISLLLEAGDLTAGHTEWTQIAESARNSQSAQEIHLRLAASDGTLAQLLESWRLADNVSADALRSAAGTLREGGNKEAALSILEFLYRRELDQGHLDAANFLGLAEVRLERNDVAGAMIQLHRMVLVTADPFETLMPAADVLSEHGKNTEATEFVKLRIHAVPWDANAKLRLVSLGPSENRVAVLTAVASDAQVSYLTRADAARRLAPQSIPALADTELGLLSGSRILPESAAKPYYVYARISAAEDVADPAARLNLLRQALNIAPANAEARLAALRAAIDAKRDSLALAIYRGVPSDPRTRFLGQFKLTDAERVAIAEHLAQAAERLMEPAEEMQFLRAAIALRPEKERAPLESKLQAIETEQERLAANAARQPVIKNVPDQDTIVRPRIVVGQVGNLRPIVNRPARGQNKEGQ